MQRQSSVRLVVSLEALHCASVPLLRKSDSRTTVVQCIVRCVFRTSARCTFWRCALCAVWFLAPRWLWVRSTPWAEYSIHCAEPAACNMPCCNPEPASAAARISLSVSRCTEGPLPSAAAAEWIDDVGTVFAPAESDRWAMVCSTPSRAERSHQKEPKTRAWRTQKEWPQRTVCRRALRSVPLQRCNAATLRHATVQAQRTDSELWRLKMSMRRVCH